MSHWIGGPGKMTDYVPKRAYATVTIVVPAEHADDAWRAAEDATEAVQFFTVSPGISDLAYAQGADPESWEADE